jgi:hypothetical protein
MSTLQDALRKLAEARRSEEIIANHIALIQADIEATPQGKALAGFKRDLAEVRSGSSALTEEIRAAALDAFYLTKTRTPAKGVQIKEFAKVVYAPNLALGWCLAHAMKYLRLDAKAFEKAAPVLRDLGAPVELTKEARVQIATDLSVWLLDPLLASEEISLLRQEQDLAKKES